LDKKAGTHLATPTTKTKKLRRRTPVHGTHKGSPTSTSSPSVPERSTAETLALATKINSTDDDDLGLQETWRSKTISGIGFYYTILYNIMSSKYI